MADGPRRRLFVVFSLEHFYGYHLHDLVGAMEERFGCDVLGAGIRGFDEVCKIFCIDDLPPATVEQIEQFVNSHRIQESAS